jgi:hypothetical protein
VTKSEFDAKVVHVISENKWVLDCGNSVPISNEDTTI